MLAVAVWTLVIAALALIVSLTTLVVVLRAEQRRHRAATQAVVELRNPNGIWTLTNTGSADARIHSLTTVGCTLEVDDDHAPVDLLRAGAEVPLIVQTPDPARAWVVVVHSAVADNKWLYAAWWAPSAGPDLVAEQHRQHQAVQGLRNRIRSLTLRQLEVVQPVGPAGAPNARVRAHPEWRRKAGIETVMSLAVQASSDR